MLNGRKIVVTRGAGFIGSAVVRSLLAHDAEVVNLDLRYSIDAAKLRNELGWGYLENFESGLEKIVRRYLNNRNWWKRILSGACRTERLGLAIA